MVVALQVFDPQLPSFASIHCCNIPSLPDVATSPSLAYGLIIPHVLTREVTKLKADAERLIGKPRTVRVAIEAGSSSDDSDSEDEAPPTKNHSVNPPGRNLDSTVHSS